MRVFSLKPLYEPFRKKYLKGEERCSGQEAGVGDGFKKGRMTNGSHYRKGSQHNSHKVHIEYT